MPRPNLRHAQPLVRAFCAHHGLTYVEASLFGSFAEAVRHLPRSAPRYAWERR